MNRKLIDLSLLECFKKKFEKMFDKKLEVMNTEVEKRFEEVNANFTSAINGIKGALIAKGVNVPEGASIYDMIGLINNNMIVSLSSYSCTIGAGSVSSAAYNAGATTGFGTITSQSAPYLNSTGANLKAMVDFPKSSLQLTISTKHYHGGYQGNYMYRANIYANGTKVFTGNILSGGYGGWANTSITCTLPAIKKGNVIQVICTNDVPTADNGYHSVETNHDHKIVSATIKY